MTRTKLEIDGQTGETIERPYTDEENAQADKDQNEILSPIQES